MPQLLVVDDEPHIRSALVRALTLVGYGASEVASGQEALALLENTTFDLMILDMMMPGISGIEVMQQARLMHPDLIIIVLTGHANLESAIAAVKAQANDYLLKPANTRDIVEAVTKALQLHTTHRQREELVELMDRALEVLKQPAKDDRPAPERLPYVDSERFVLAYPLRLDRQLRIVIQVNAPETEIELTRGEAAVLANLTSNPGLVRSCQQLVQAIWGYEVDRNEAESLIRPYISRLRGKLDDTSKKPRLIQTVRGAGYRFVSR
jgi:DNA-binding response OmpR family regulator